MKNTFLIHNILIAAIAISLMSCKTTIDNRIDSKFINSIANKYKLSIVTYGDSLRNPRNIDTNGNIRFVPSSDWTSGFYPGCLWYMYELTSDTIFKNEAIIRTSIVEQEKYNGVTHDMGFKLYCSYGNGYRLTHNVKYKDILLQGAKTLITRYDSTIGCIRSWDHHSHLWKFPVIIDNMMNLELLFWAFYETGDSLYYNIAVSHADRTLENHFRDDFSSYHVIGYDSITGDVVSKNTHQGYNDASAWARGQAWALYGFTLMYSETQNIEYLNQANGIASFILNHPNLPDDGVPYWDFDDPNIPDAPRDASAAAIICSGLYELCLYSSDSLVHKAYADKILNSLSSDNYLITSEHENPFLLDHSTGNMPKNDEIDIPIIYADYYYLEAIIRKTKLSN